MLEFPRCAVKSAVSGDGGTTEQNGFLKEIREEVYSSLQFESGERAYSP